MSRHVRKGVAGSGAGHGHTPKGVSCPVPLSRPSVLMVLGIRAPLRGKPNELDAVHLAAGHDAPRNCVLYGAVESLAPRVGLLLFGAVRRPLSVKFGAHQLDVTGAYRRPVQEGRTFCPQSTRAVIRTRRSSCMDGVQRASACAVCCVACQSMIGAVTGSPSSSVPVSTIRTVKGISNPDTPSRCLRTASRVFLTPPLSSRSAKQGDHRIGRTFLGR